MNVEFLTKGFQKTDAMDLHMRESTIEAVKDFLKNEKDVHFRVVVDETSHRIQARRPHFVCEIHLKTAASKKFFKVSKGGEDFYDVVLRAGHTIRRVLEKKANRRAKMRAHALGGKLISPPAA